MILSAPPTLTCGLQFPFLWHEWSGSLTCRSPWAPGSRSQTARSCRTDSLRSSESAWLSWLGLGSQQRAAALQPLTSRLYGRGVFVPHTTFLGCTMPIAVGTLRGLLLSETQQAAQLSSPSPPLSVRPHRTGLCWGSSDWARGGQG